MSRNEDKNLIYVNSGKDGNKIKNFICHVYGCFSDIFSLLFKTKDINKKYNVAICSQFKDEGKYLREWIEYHLIVGVEHFYLYNNGSSDNSREVLQPYINSVIVTLKEWVGHGNACESQNKAYLDCFNENSSEVKWIGLFDIDEFVVLNDDRNVYAFLSKYNRTAGAIMLYWKMFGSSGLIERNVNNGLVVEDFTFAFPKYTNMGKSFYNTNYGYKRTLKYCSIISHWFIADYMGIPLLPRNCFGFGCIGTRRNIINGQCPAHLNHYCIKSKGEFFDKLVRWQGGEEGKFLKAKQFYDFDSRATEQDFSAYKYLHQLKSRLGISYEK